MSQEYDGYLSEHIKNVNNAFRWMVDNIDLYSLYSYLDISKAEDNLKLGHDQSKFNIDEYRPYDAYFYGGNRSNKVCNDFDYAWLIHQHKNPHHWQYWVLINDDDGKNKPLEMPKEYVLEMIADWWSFSWKDGNLKSIFSWYEDHKKEQCMHKRTRELVDVTLKRIWDKLDEDDILKHGDEDPKYGVPEQKKFPMPDADHVKSAIRFFNYVYPKYEEELAKAILARMKEYGLVLGEDISVGDENRFKKYIPKEAQEE